MGRDTLKPAQTIILLCDNTAVQMKMFDSRFFIEQFSRLTVDIKRLTLSLLGAKEAEVSGKKPVTANRLKRWTDTFKRPLKWLKVLFSGKKTVRMDDSAYPEINSIINQIEVELPLINTLDVGEKSNKKRLKKLYKLLTERFLFLHNQYNIFARNSRIKELDEIHLVDIENFDKLKRLK